MKDENRNLAKVSRIDFPFFTSQSNNKNPLIYLDHAATSQKPKVVLDTLANYYFNENANVHRGAHQLSATATKAFEDSREITAKFINAFSKNEIVFTRNATESINLISRSWGDDQIKEGDEILITLMEHHSNIVPWQLLAKRKGCKLIYAGITKTGELDLEDLKNKINEKTRLVSVLHVSNTLGCCNPIQDIVSIAHSKGALVLLDACQSLAHKPIDVQSLNIDFLAGSSHKLCGPTGIGFLWSKESILNEIPPFLGGGEMIDEVLLDKSSWAELPHKFEAGTPAIGEAIGMGSALNYLSSLGLDNIQNYEKFLTNYLFNKLKEIEGIRIFGPDPDIQPFRAPLATFIIKNIHSNDIAELLDSNNICIRSGHHCCQPLHKYYRINSSARVSLSFTTTTEEIDLFLNALESSINFIKKYS